MTAIVLIDNIGTTPFNFKGIKMTVTNFIVSTDKLINSLKNIVINDENELYIIDISKINEDFYTLYSSVMNKNTNQIKSSTIATSNNDCTNRIESIFEQSLNINELNRYSFSIDKISFLVLAVLSSSAINEKYKDISILIKFGAVSSLDFIFSKKTQIYDKKITYSLRYDSSHPPLIYDTEELYNQILDNLLA